MENPRVLMVTNEDDALGAKYEKNYPALREKDIDILFPEEVKKKYPDLVFKGGVSTDKVFVQHPFYKHTYVDLKESDKIIEKDKMKSFFEICQYLGIVEIQEEIKATAFSSASREGSAGGAKGGVGAEFEMAQTKDNTQNNGRVTTMKFKTSGKVNYEEACKRAQENNLLEDNEIMSVIDFCNPEKLNRLEEYKIELTLSNEANDLFEVAGNLSLMKGVLNISGKYKSKFTERNETTKTLYLKFE